MTTVTVPETGERFDLERPGALAAWNRALNRRYGMENLSGHPSAIVRRIEARRRTHVAALAAAEPFEVAVDLGAEDGSLTATWAGAGRRTLLLDIDPRGLRGAGREGVVGDACRIPLRSGSVDLVVLSAILEHLPDPGAAVAESARVLRAGGRLVAYVPWDRAVVRLKRWARRVGFGLGKLHAGRAPGHLQEFDRRGLQRLLRPWFARSRVRLHLRSLGYYAEAYK